MGLGRRVQAVQRLLAVGLLRKEIGRMGPVRIRPGNLRTLLWLQASFGSVGRAIEPLTRQEPDIDRLLHIAAIIHVSTGKRPGSFEREREEIQRLKTRLEEMPRNQLDALAQMVAAALAPLIQEIGPTDPANTPLSRNP